MRAGCDLHTPSFAPTQSTYTHPTQSRSLYLQHRQEIADVKQLIYRSEPFGFDRAALAAILVGARRNNQRDGITGALICRHDLYLQLIEGSDAAIDALYARITRDDRHDNIRMLLSDTVDRRMFPEWAMLDDEMPSIAWSAAEVAAGAVEAATPGALRAVFERVADTARAREHPSA